MPKKYEVRTSSGLPVFEGNHKKCEEYIAQALQKGSQPGFLSIHPCYKELIDLDSKKGSEAWVIDRDIFGDPCEIAGVVFVTAVNGVALVAPYLGDSGDLDCILQDCVDETAKNMECNLLAYPLEDCFWSKEAAKQAVKKPTA